MLRHYDGKIAKWWMPDDVQFIDEFLTPEFIEKHKFYQYGRDPHTGQLRIISRDPEGEGWFFKLTLSDPSELEVTIGMPERDGYDLVDEEAQADPDQGKGAHHQLPGHLVARHSLQTLKKSKEAQSRRIAIK